MHNKMAQASNVENLSMSNNQNSKSTPLRAMTAIAPMDRWSAILLASRCQTIPRSCGKVIARAMTVEEGAMLKRHTMVN
jgi:hypothetical protein